MGAYWAYTAYITYDDVKNGDYVSVAIGITPVGKVSKVAKFVKMTKSASKAWNKLKPFKGKTRYNGESGSKRQLSVGSHTRKHRSI